MQTERSLSKSGMIFQFLKGAKRFFTAGILFACLSTLADMIRPKIIEYTVDGILGDKVFNLPFFLSGPLAKLGGIDYLRTHLWVPAIAVVICTLIAVMLRYLYQINTTKGSETFVKTMRDSLFDHIEHLSTQWHSLHQTGDIIQRCTTDVEEVKSFLSEQLITLMGMLITIVFALLFIFRTSAPLGWIAVASIPLLVIYSFWFHQNVASSFLECDENEGVLSTIAQENLTGVRVVRAFGRERREQLRFSEQNEVVTRKWIHLGKYLCTYWFCGDFLTGSVSVAVLCLGSSLCVHNKLTVGGLLSVISYLTMLIRPVRNMGRLLSELSKTSVSVTRLLDIMKAPIEQDVPDAGTPAMDGDISFTHVSFSYPGQPELLHDINFTIPSGSTLGILGGTGSGKSTIAHLLARLYDLPGENGRITVGGHDIQHMQAGWVRQNVGFVLQEPFLFSRTIADNIAITRKDASMYDVRKAARAACLEASVDDFPKGFDTYVGERGVTLSGGQKQRAAIARTLTLNTPILIFDDSLSAVDAETDALIRENLKTYMGKATVILISHRITTLMAADQILILEDGVIADRGTHAELAARPGLYRTICEIQQGEEEMNA